MNELQTTEPQRIKRLKPKQRLTLEYWLNPESETFGNLYQSCVKAKFAPKYALNISHLNPKWLSETLEQVELRPEHIKQGIQKIATGDINSKSVDDTRLKAYELLGRYAGMDKDKHVNITVVQPILGGASKATEPRIYIDSTQTQPKAENPTS